MPLNLFKKKKVKKPKITIEGIEVFYDVKSDWWKVDYGGFRFLHFNSQLDFPGLEQLRIIVNTIEELDPE